MRSFLRAWQTNWKTGLTGGKDAGGWVAALALGLAVLGGAPAAWAQSLEGLDLSPAQQQRLQQLPESQKQQLLEQYSQRQQGGEEQSGEETSQAEEVDQRRKQVAEEAQAQYGEASPIEQRLRARLEAPSGQESRIDPAIVQDLEQYGYDLFQGPPNTFAPVTEIPVPARYTVGPGDSIEVMLYGQKNAQYSLEVDRNGQINFPEIGPLNVAGQDFAQVRELIQDRVEEQFIGVEASITMGPLRSIRVFVLGDVMAPGSYTVSGLSTLTNALLASGGVKRIGSLRNIALKRQGREVTTLDLYDLLLEGDTGADVRLQPGDVIHVPTVGPTVGIAGEVQRPAIYELEGKSTVGGVLDLAGGLNPNADRAHARLMRRTDSGTETVSNLNLASDAARQRDLRDGDVLHVYEAPQRTEEAVFLKGHFRRPGTVEWSSGMRFSDVVTSVSEDLMPNPDMQYAVLARESGPRRSLEVRTFSPGDALESPGSEADPRIRPRDRLYVFGTTGDRAEQLRPIIQQLRDQARHNDPPKVVRVRGNVRHPGAYPWHPGMRVQDLVDAALDIRARTDLEYALVKRTGERRGTFSVRLGEALSDPASPENATLQPQDELLVFTDGSMGAIGEAFSGGNGQGAGEGDQSTAGDGDGSESVSREEAEQAAQEAGITRQKVQKKAAQEGISPREAARQLARQEGLSREDLAGSEGSESGGEGEESDDSEAAEADRASEAALRRALIDPVIRELRQQAKKGYPAPVVEVAGRVRSPGAYPLEADMRVSDLIRAANGLEESAYGLRAEVTRFRVVDGEYREVGHQTVNLAEVYEGDTEADLVLQPHDRLHVKKLPNWQEQIRVELHGEVRFPGTYTITEGETLTEVIDRAGGLTDNAFPEGAVLTRERLKEKERERLDKMTERLKKDLAQISLSQAQQDPGSAEGYAALQNMLDELKATEAVGRLSMDLPAVLEGKRADVALKDGDELYIPDPPQEVTVMGEVQYPTSHLYRPGLQQAEYIGKSGGTTARADESRIYVIRAGGEVETGQGSGWFARSGQIKPGDTIVVPLNVDYVRPLKVATDVSQVLYQLGVAAASWQTVGAF